LNEAPFLFIERHKVQGARHKEKEPEFRSQEIPAWGIGKATRREVGPDERSGIKANVKI